MLGEIQQAAKYRKTVGKQIEAAIQQDDWPTARRLIRAALCRQPDSHWLLTRLGLTYYEQYEYERALFYEEKAHKLAPRCPLVLWDLAGTNYMLERFTEAQRIYRGLISRGVSAIAFGVCGEGLAHARGLVADCWFRMAYVDRKRGRRSQAIAHLRKHLALRGPGCHSIYKITEARDELRALLSANRSD